MPAEPLTSYVQIGAEFERLQQEKTEKLKRIMRNVNDEQYEQLLELARQLHDTRMMMVLPLLRDIVKLPPFDEIKPVVKKELGIPFDIKEEDIPDTQTDLEAKDMAADPLEIKQGNNRKQTHKFPGVHRLARYKASRHRRR